ncbi:MAG: sortase [Acidobacteria bacterium]|nr:sortase [Acidobacteriota bacterium]
MLVSGAAAISRGSWLYVKARIAQVLLRSAWQRTLAGATDVRPWPWADTSPVARISFGRSHEEMIVLAGASGRTLTWAPGHLHGTSMPGESGNCVISAHRDTHFSALRDLVPGDRIRIERADGRAFLYSVEGSEVVTERETWVAGPRGSATLTLITCYPFDAIVPGGPQRYVVTARLVGGAVRRMPARVAVVPKHGEGSNVLPVRTGDRLLRRSSSPSLTAPPIRS